MMFTRIAIDLDTQHFLPGGEILDSYQDPYGSLVQRTFDILDNHIQEISEMHPFPEMHPFLNQDYLEDNTVEGNVGRYLRDLYGV